MAVSVAIPAAAAVVSAGVPALALVVELAAAPALSEGYSYSPGALFSVEEVAASYGQEQALAA